MGGSEAFHEMAYHYRSIWVNGRRGVLTHKNQLCYTGSLLHEGLDMLVGNIAVLLLCERA